MGRHSTAITVTTITPPDSPPRKRKRDHSPKGEIEVDVSAPEPPSKKALRKAKKTKGAPSVAVTQPKTIAVSTDTEVASEEAPKAPIEIPKRSDYGIWIGNLPWTTTKLDLRTFLTRDSEITDNKIIRLHMPPPSKGAIAASRQKIKPQNQGFAYVDFSSKEALAEALALSEKLIAGRRVLIKDAKSFEGRPEKPNKEVASSANRCKSPSRRVFVGNLGFDTTREDLQGHFSCCGEILDIHIATFEDTGKCKGYAWVEFVYLEAAEAAMRGWVNFEQKGGTNFEDDEIAEALVDQMEPKKKPRVRKWWINRLEGRPLRMEYAEGKEMRYKKRFGKDSIARKDKETAVDSKPQPTVSPITAINEASSSQSRNQKVQRAGPPTRKVDARTIKPAAALAAAPRLSGGIVESQGKKTMFE